MLSTSPSPTEQIENQAISSLLKKLLIEPSNELRARPSNHFRSQLVEIGASLAGPGRSATAENLKICSESIESLHLGSLIVDDIQDGSLVRREGSSLHTKLGVPHALSIGNWLYFHALKSLSQLELCDSSLLMLQNEWVTAVEWAHYGQVMDLRISVKDLAIEEISAVCHYTALYKTGCITGLAISMGTLVAGADDERTRAVKELGCALGIYLQQLNDIGNIIGRFDSEKRYEDLLSYKPSFVWPLVIEHYGREAFYALLDASRELPNPQRVQAWLKEYPLHIAANDKASKAFTEVIQTFKLRYPDADVAPLFILKDRIHKAYE